MVAGKWLIRLGVLALVMAVVLPLSHVGIAMAASATDTDIPNPDAYTCNQLSFITFESMPDGTNLSASAINGVQFTTSGGYTWLVGDFATRHYTGKYPNGGYTSEGTHWAWLGPNQGSGRIDFVNGPATVFSLLVSDVTPVYLDAYNASGTLLATAGPSANNFNTGHMDELKITRDSADIAYVIAHDSGNYFEVDSICTDAPGVPNQQPPANTPPTVGAGGSYSGNEGSAIALSKASASDTDGDTLTYSWSYTTVSAPAGASCSFDNASALNPYFTCNDNGTFNVTLSVNDGTNPPVTDSAKVTVANVPPTITSFAPDRTSALTGQSVTFTGKATDPSSNDLTAGLTWAFSIDGAAYSAFGSSNKLTTSFSTCGSHSVSAEAQDKDGGTSGPATANTVSAYDGAWQPPLYYGQSNVAKAGSVVPVKVLVGCNGTYLTNLAPTIQLIKGTTDSPANYVWTLSASSADTTGVMRLASPQYIYNLLVPTGYPAGTLFTVRVRPFGDGDRADSMYVQIMTK